MLHLRRRKVLPDQSIIKSANYDHTKKRTAPVMFAHSPSPFQSAGYTPWRFRDFASFFGGLPLRPTFLIGRTEESRSPGEVDVVEDAMDEAEDEGSEEGDVICIGWRR